MIEFDLYNEVIVDFSKDETFTRQTSTINDIGREVLTPLPPFTVFCYAHPATDADLREVSRQGYHVEDMIKIFADVNADIKADDIITYSQKDYRVMKTNIKLVGKYSKYFAELLKVT